jgi:hypothetical protein
MVFKRIYFVIMFLCIVVLSSFVAENLSRSDEVWPRLNWQSIYDGSFISRAEDGMKSSFPYREQIKSAFSKLEYLCGVTEQNGIFITPDG